MSEKLKPCPFCGSSEMTVYNPSTSFGLFQIICSGCGAMVSFKERRRIKTAAEAWNRRDGESKNYDLEVQDEVD